MNHSDMTGAQVVATIRSLTAAGIRGWIVGGWGIDALIGRQTRSHHDLDLLIDTQDLPRAIAWLDAEGFTRVWVWPDNLPVTVGGKAYESAFVSRHCDGRELDVHSVFTQERPARVAVDPAWLFPVAAWSTTGSVDHAEVPCVTAAAQHAMHSGYDLPAKQRADLRLLESLS